MKMTKYQLEHFKRKVDRQFDPLIDEQELLVKQYKTEATDKAVDKLSKKIGADKIINKFREAEKMLEEARATAMTFFEKQKPSHTKLTRSPLVAPDAIVITSTPVPSVTVCAAPSSPSIP